MRYHTDDIPAFPRGPIFEDCGQPYGQQAGMSLRDWFAGQALSGICSTLSGAGDVRYHAISSDVYALADAMLKAKEQ
jgi:hypothetical protein